MDRIRSGVSRREVIENYARYDLLKKHPDSTVPDFAEWDWTTADAIDDQMSQARLKVGVPAGYILWDEVSITCDDLRQCAIHNAINEALGTTMRRLGDLEVYGYLGRWSPPSERAWFTSIVSGKVPDDTGPILLRPAVKCEYPASWYVEDGSGRATAFIKFAGRFGPSVPLARGFLGTAIDRNSKFMYLHFRELYI